MHVTCVYESHMCDDSYKCWGSAWYGVGGTTEVRLIGHDARDLLVVTCVMMKVTPEVELAMHGKPQEGTSKTT